MNSKQPKRHAGKQLQVQKGSTGGLVSVHALVARADRDEWSLLLMRCVMLVGPFGNLIIW